VQKRRLGDTDLEIVRVGFGAWAIGGAGWEFAWGPQDDGESIAAIHRALELGVNWIDTAAIYGLGHSEEVIARALDGRRDRPYVFTKCGLVPDSRNRPRRNLEKESIREELERSLRRLRVEAIDLYQVHWPNEDLEEAWAELAAQKQAGKVRWIGLSNVDVAQLRACAAIAPVSSLQPPYSLLDRKVEAELLPYCLEHGIGVINYSPMYSGLLSGTMTHERLAALPGDDWRVRDPEFRPPRLAENLGFVETLRRVGKRHGNATPGAVAVAWTLLHPAVTGAIAGFRRPDQVSGVLGAAHIHLTDADRAEIDAAMPG
jgi:aryl-alcohol dehydrogenase-like predicted oxidoreductase